MGNEKTVGPLLPGPLLEVMDLHTQFSTCEGVVMAVDGVSFEIGRGESLALVGESGCGKTALALSILRLLPSPPGEIVKGKVMFQGNDLLRLAPKELRKIRGSRIAMVFQEPMSSLNPVMKVGEQVAEAFRLHRNTSRAEARDKTVEMFRRVRMPDADARFSEYPHMLSGGMKQRVMIAMALICGPSLLIADEPTTAVDVTVQAQVLDLLKGVQKEYGMGMLLISHDLSVVAGAADSVSVMYASRIVEQAGSKELLRQPGHPYTSMLMRSLPGAGAGNDRLDEIPGVVPDPLAFPSGCRFHPRCPISQARCMEDVPLLREKAPGRKIACHFPFDMCADQA